MKRVYFKSWNRGSHTIEAALLLPLIFFVLLYFIYFTFYLHDKEVMTNVAYETALIGSSGRFIEESSTRRYSKEEILAYGNSRIDGILISTKLKDIIVENGGKEVTVYIVGEFLNPLFGGFGIPMLMEKEIRIAQKVKCQDGSDYVRKSQVLIEGIKKLWE